MIFIRLNDTCFMIFFSILFTNIQDDYRINIKSVKLDTR